MSKSGGRKKGSRGRPRGSKARGARGRGHDDLTALEQKPRLILVQADTLPRGVPLETALTPPSKRKRRRLWLQERMKSEPSTSQPSKCNSPKNSLSMSEIIKEVRRKKPPQRRGLPRKVMFKDVSEEQVAHDEVEVLDSQPRSPKDGSTVGTPISPQNLNKEHDQDELQPKLLYAEPIDGTTISYEEDPIQAPIHEMYATENEAEFTYYEMTEVDYTNIAKKRSPSPEMNAAKWIARRIARTPQYKSYV